MARSSKSQTQRLLLVVALAVVAFGISAVSAGRPCKTLFISSYSISLRRLPQPSSSSGFVTVFTEITHSRPLLIIDDADGEDVVGADRFPAATLRHLGPLRTTAFPGSSSSSSSSPYWPYDMSSLRDRTKDILSVVVALLFGVGCGALTAASLYLAWSLLVAPRHHGDDGYDSASSDDDVFSPKKIGYVKIPAEDHLPTEKPTGV